MSVSDDFLRCEKVTLVYEGGKVDDPNDPGGRTNQGVTKRVFSAFLSKQSKPVRDVYSMTNDERDAIYNEQYFLPTHCNEYPVGLALCVFDGAVHSGNKQSIKWLQKALGIAVDGTAGMVTVDAVVNASDITAVIHRYCMFRKNFFRGLKTFSRYGKGWMRRVEDCERIALKWEVNEPHGVPVTFADVEIKKASIIDAKAPPSTAPADAVTSGGAVSTGLSSAQSTLAPLEDNSYIQWLIHILIVIGVLLAVFGFVYGMYVRRKRKELEDILDLAPSKETDPNAE